MKYLFILALLLIIVQVFRSYISNNNPGDSFELADLNKKIIEMKRENMILQIQILEKSALSVIAEKAKKDGFVKGSIIYLRQDEAK